MEPADHPDVTGRDTFGRGRLSAAASQAARDQTRLQASQQAVASEVIAFQVIQQRAQLASGAEIDPARVAATLSAREREVIGRVAAGRSDGEIASELFISKKTASVHVANIKSKLGASSRVEIAMLAAKLHLVSDGVAPADDATRGTGPAGPAGVCPFKGLASFDAADGGYFFGRERVIAELVARLAATTFVVVVGPSGSGKSSVVKAGLAPALRAGVLPGSDDWRLAVLRPGEHPLDALGRALRAAMRDADPVDDEHPAEEWLDRLPTGGRLVVIVDQFEEAYTVCRDAQERAQFLDRLAALARAAGRRALVVVAIRSEFYGRCAEHREIADLASTSTVLLGPMSADELTRAIELPARAAGLRMDTTLVPALVADVLQQPGGLPMLSSTLLELWQRRDGRSLRMETYRGLGGISGAVGRVAETALGRLSPGDQGIARSIFLRLATVGDNGVASRRRVPIGEIDGGRSADIARVMAVLVDGRLLTVDDGYVEPAHEALLREWPRMRQWLEDDAQARRIREHLARTAREWDETGREPGELYRGQRLAAAVEWASAHGDELNDVERAFLDASQRASEADLARQRRINVRLRGLLGAAAVLLVVAVVAGTVALRQADDARASADYARVRSPARPRGSPTSRTPRSGACWRSRPRICCPGRRHRGGPPRGVAGRCGPAATPDARRATARPRRRCRRRRHARGGGVGARGRRAVRARDRRPGHGQDRVDLPIPDARRGDRPGLLQPRWVPGRDEPDVGGRGPRPPCGRARHPRVRRGDGQPGQAHRPRRVRDAAHRRVGSRIPRR
jgi:DNA-binding CsgD family transcriptional regulator